MNNNLELYHELLFIKCPWLDTTTTDQKYLQLLQSLPPENFTQQPLYKLAFPKPLTPKRKYFYAIIENEARRYLNTINKLVAEASNNNEKKFWVQGTLKKKLKEKLKEIEKIIEAHSFHFSSTEDKKLSVIDRDNAYIVQFLKHQLVRLYLEIQNNFPAYTNDDPLTENEIHSLYFSEVPPADSFLKQAEGITLPVVTDEIVIQPEEKTINVIKGDIREIKKGVLKYSDIIDKPDRFALAEMELFKEGLIDDKYKFKKKYGNIEKMAALIHILIQKKHFKPFHFNGGKKKITDLEIRRFLNHRYIANFDKEVRNFRDQKLLNEYLSNHLALSLLIPS